MADTADSAIKYVGVDGCKAGWIGVGLSDNGCAKVEVCGDFPSLVDCFGDARIILVDMPIGLLEYPQPGGRDCDKAARKVLKGSGSSVFSAPSKPFVKEARQRPEEWKYSDAKKWHEEKFGGKSITAQTFAITRKIGEVGAFLKTYADDSPTIREAHPEVCFWALNKALSAERQLASKHEALGFGQRLQIVSHWVPKAVDMFGEVPRRENSKSPMVKPDDFLDAITLAITAKLGCRNGFRRLPKDLSPDRKKAPEMVYAEGP